MGFAPAPCLGLTDPLRLGFGFCTSYSFKGFGFSTLIISFRLWFLHQLLLWGFGFSRLHTSCRVWVSPINSFSGFWVGFRVRTRPLPLGSWVFAEHTPCIAFSFSTHPLILLFVQKQEGKKEHLRKSHTSHILKAFMLAVTQMH